jgi:C4-dicarboxylate-binding protein DctP
MRIIKQILTKGAFTAGLTVVALGVTTSVNSAQVINLTAIDGYSPKSMWVKEFINFYIPLIDKGLAKTGNYKIKWNQAWGGQIVKPKGVMGALQKGLGDIGVVTTVFHSDKVPLQMVAYATPFVTNDPVLLSRTVDGLVKKYPQFRAAFTKFNQHYLTNGAVLATYNIFTKKEVKSMGDMKGVKIGTAGLNALWLKNTGSVAVKGSLVKYHNWLGRGVVGGIMLWTESVVNRKMYEVAPFMLKSDLGTANSKAITMNAKSWAKLPGEVKKVISVASIAYRDQMSRAAVKVAKIKRKQFTEKGGTINVLSQAERMKWAKIMPNTATAWAGRLEKKGIPGKAILTDYMNSMRAANQPILRQWDKE